MVCDMTHTGRSTAKELAPQAEVVSSLEAALHAPVAGLIKYGAEEAERIACVLTGHGLKDPQTALAHAGSVVPCEPEIAAVERAVLG